MGPCRVAAAKTDRVIGRTYPVRKLDAFDHEVANIRRYGDQCYAEGLVNAPWKDLGVEGKIELLANRAAKHDVPFDRFLQAAKHVLGGAVAFTPDDEWHTRRYWKSARADWGRDREPQQVDAVGLKNLQEQRDLAAVEEQGDRDMDPQQRSAVVREAFEAITAVGFMKWKAEELALGYEGDRGGPAALLQGVRKEQFAGFQKMAANASEDRLLDVRDFWIDKANVMGLKEWQQVLSAGQGAKPWYKALQQEIAADALLRAALEEVQGVVANGGLARTQADGSVAFIPFASLDRDERLRLLTQVRSTGLSTSIVDWRRPRRIASSRAPPPGSREKCGLRV